jgi:hypothetical protein
MKSRCLLPLHLQLHPALTLVWSFLPIRTALVLSSDATMTDHKIMVAPGTNGKWNLDLVVVISWSIQKSWGAWAEVLLITFGLIIMMMAPATKALGQWWWGSSLPFAFLASSWLCPPRSFYPSLSFQVSFSASDALSTFLWPPPLQSVLGTFDFFACVLSASCQSF